MTDTFTFTDGRTGNTFDAPIEDGTVRATALRQAKASDDDFGLMTYDPAFMNTASVRSAITFIDGDKGILRHRGYPIEQLAERSTYLETAYLLIFGELPTQEELAHWAHDITHHTFLHENVKRLMEGFRYDAHPMGMLISVVAALSTFYPEASDVDDHGARMRQVVRLIAKVPTIAAWSFRHNQGLPYVYPDNELGFTANLLSMIFRMAEPVLRRAGARAGARGALHPARRPRAELQRERDAVDRVVESRPVRVAGRRRGCALRPAARRRERSGPADAGGDRRPEARARVHRERQGRARPPDGLRPSRLQELRPARADHQADGGRGLRDHRPEPAARHRARAGEDRARGRLLRLTQAVPERRLLLGADLPGARPADCDVPGHVRDPADGRLARAVARGRAGPGAEDRAAAPDLHRLRRARLRRARGPAAPRDDVVARARSELVRN